MIDKKKNPEKLRQEIIAEVTALRIQFRDIVQRYQANLEAKMVWSINNLTASELQDLPEGAQDRDELAEMLESLKLLKLKPQKGRIKDIKKINDTIEMILIKLGNE